MATPEQINLLPGRDDAIPVNLVAPGVQGFSNIGLTLSAELSFQKWRDLGVRLRTYDAR